jgi:hypothetical protein
MKRTDGQDHIMLYLLYLMLGILLLGYELPPSALNLGRRVQWVIIMGMVMVMLIAKDKDHTPMALRDLFIRTMLSVKAANKDTPRHRTLNRGMNRITLLHLIPTLRHLCLLYPRLLGIHIPILPSQPLDELVIKPSYRPLVNLQSLQVRIDMHQSILDTLMPMPMGITTTYPTNITITRHTVEPDRR